MYVLELFGICADSPPCDYSFTKKKNNNKKQKKTKMLWLGLMSYMKSFFFGKPLNSLIATRVNQHIDE